MKCVGSEQSWKRPESPWAQKPPDRQLSASEAPSAVAGLGQVIPSPGGRRGSREGAKDDLPAPKRKPASSHCSRSCMPHAGIPGGTQAPEHVPAATRGHSHHVSGSALRDTQPLGLPRTPAATGPGHLRPPPHGPEGRSGGFVAEALRWPLRGQCIGLEGVQPLQGPLIV